MRPFQLSGHIGASVSALVDGQLSPAEEERVWTHVLGCPGCRRLVENEGWTKTRLRAFAMPAAPDEGPTAPPSLLGALYDVEAWAEVDRIEHASRRRVAATALVGAGSVGLAVLGIVGLTSPPLGAGEVPGAPSQTTIRSEQVGSLMGAAIGVAALAGRRAASGSPTSVPVAPRTADVHARPTVAPSLVGHTAR